MILDSLELPSTWRRSPVSAHFRRVSRKGFDDKPLLSVYREHGVVPRGFTDDNWNLMPTDLTAYQLVEPGDLAVNKMKAWQGSLGLSQLEGVVSPAYFIYTPVSLSFDQRYLNYLIRSRLLAAEFARLSDGVRPQQWDLDPKAFERVPLPEPPMKEQRRIADYLDRETATIDALIDKQLDLLAKLKERRSTVIRHHLETGGYMADPVLGEVQLNKPGWRRMPAKRLCTIKTGGEDSGNATDEGEFPFYVRGARVLRSDGYAFEGPAVLTPGDGQGGTGKVFHYAEGRFQAHQRVYVFHDFRGVAAKYFYYWLSTFLREIALANSYTVTMESLRQPLLERLPVFFPMDEAEQDAIGRAIEVDVARIDALIAKAERFIELAQERRAALITAAVTGQIEIPTED
ncbi:restriction endonuclease subunit S [Micrococcus terreus]|uniref:restriction endonuclease subunit S n=1 Tax=Micrococcus terreus TaxID=574650 RepID=UPI0021A4425A|nr:restriction endonuclease subunit S [Micrococcus terreus]MCT2088779.1 restriction endonuclease subunit S [Micrococcus terreus]